MPPSAAPVSPAAIFAANHALRAKLEALLPQDGRSLHDRMLEFCRVNPKKAQQLLIAARAIPTPPQNLSIEFGRPDPRIFIKEVLRWEPSPAALAAGYTDPWTPDQDLVLRAVMAHQKVAVPAGIGVGKTRISAGIVLWFLLSKRPSLVITTAPTWDLIEKVMWPALHSLREQALQRGVKLPGTWLQTEIRLSEGDDWRAYGLNAKPKAGDLSATGFHGRHSANVLVVFDEATDIAPEIWEAASNAVMRPGDRWLAIGNPTNPASRFAEITKLPTWHTIYLSCENHPNVLHDNPDIIVGGPTRAWVAEKLHESGSREGPMYQAKVLGHFPTHASDALIHSEWTEAARLRGQAYLEKLESGGDPPPDDHKGVALGLDVAGEGEDLCVLSAIQNGRWFIPWLNGQPTWRVGRDLMTCVDLVVGVCRLLPVRVLVLDDTGLGQGVSARLRQLLRKEGLSPYVATVQLPRSPKQSASTKKDVWLIPRNFGAKADEDMRFPTQKDELWWGAREVLREGGLILPTTGELAKLALPKGNDLFSQLLTPIYDAATHGGRITVYDKRGAHGNAATERTKFLPTKSPDLAHSFCMAVYGWKKLRASAPAEVPKTQQDVFQRQTDEMVARAIARERPGYMKGRGGAAGGRLAPWQRTGRGMR